MKTYNENLATPVVRTCLDANVLEITLNRPDQLNSFTVAMHHGLKKAFEEARDNSSIRCVILTGAGRGFCAGQDLSESDPTKDRLDLTRLLEVTYNPLIKLIRSIEKPVLCAVNGVAAGAGANLALACDIVMAAESAKFIQAFAKIGLIPDAGGTWSLTHLIGEPRAKALAMTAQPLDAKTAEQWGLIWKSLPDDHLMAEVRKLATSLAKGASLGIGKTKLAIQSASLNTMDEQLALEAKLQGELGQSTDFKEGVLAFLEKRPASFSGK